MEKSRIITWIFLVLIGIKIFATTDLEPPMIFSAVAVGLAIAFVIMKFQKKNELQSRGV